MTRLPLRWQYPLPSLAAERSGVAALEFALVAPVFLVLLMGMLNIGQVAYGTSVLNGAVQQAARDSTLEGANTEQADAIVRNLVSPVLPGASYTSRRTNYYDFVDIGRAERFNDQNGNGDCDSGESYIDENRSGDWEREIGRAGNGGASDVVVYTVEVEFQPVFRVPLMPEQWGRKVLTASAIKKNQPFADQEEYGNTSGVCA